MSDIKFKKILELCLYLETGAAKLYAAFSEQSKVDEQKIFWEEICEDEKRHIAYWEELFKLQQIGSLQNPFDRPDNLLAELETIKYQVDYTLYNNNKFNDISSRMVYTFHIESMMLHPAFAILFSQLRNESKHKSPYTDYHDHLEKFSHFVHKFIPNSAEMLLICEILSKMWDRNIELANQFSQIKMLRGFLPICAKCKKIRDDQGFWNQIESYISTHSDAIFTHSLCPTCAEELYPNL